jgi:hypothetical protein
MIWKLGFGCTRVATSIIMLIDNLYEMQNWVSPRLHADFSARNNPYLRIWACEVLLLSERGDVTLHLLF